MPLLKQNLGPPPKPRVRKQPSVERLGYRVSEVEKATGLSVSTIYRHMRTGKIESVVVGGTRIILADSLNELLSGRAG
jgi:hypothetical protein